jgi:hypothetical protein
MANKTPTLTDLFEKYRYDRSIYKKSSTWFDQQTLLLGKKRFTPQQVLAAKRDNLTTKVIPGNMYMFFYEAKGKDTLPYWDKFPLIFPFRVVPGGFYGLNMHYLPYRMRLQLMDRLLQFKNNEKFNETTRIKYSWSLIGGVSKFKAAEPCVKHYLNDHVRSPFIQIHAQDWATAMMLPVERFVGSNKNAVWSDSKKAIR